jgi:hypothetical protein
VPKNPEAANKQRDTSDYSGHGAERQWIEAEEGEGYEGRVQGDLLLTCQGDTRCFGLSVREQSRRRSRKTPSSAYFSNADVLS